MINLFILQNVEITWKVLDFPVWFIALMGYVWQKTSLWPLFPYWQGPGGLYLFRDGDRCR